jgi:DNA-binding transcriptional LysR family regulator
MNYTLNQLQIFVKVTETLSITKAAEELHLTQPAVSIQLKNFQNQFAWPLTEVVGRQLYITDFGHEIAINAINLLLQAEEINTKMKARDGELVGKLRISIVSTGKYVMPYFLSPFLAEHPRVELEMDVTNKSDVIENLANNEVDFSLVSIMPKAMRVEELPLLENKLYLINKNVIDQKSHAMNHWPFIYREQGSGTRQAMEGFLIGRGIEPSKKMELTSNEAVKQAILAGLGCSVMPIIGLRKELANGELKIVKVPELPKITQWRLIWPAGKKHSAVSQAYLNFVEKEKNNIALEVFGWCKEY